MKSILYIIMVLAVLGFVHETRKRQKEKHITALYLKSIKAGPEGLARLGIAKNCLGKKYCVTVYVAPWCEVCKSSEPTFHALSKYLAKNRPDVGFGLVIGAASADQNLKKQQELAPLEAYTDNKGKLMKLRDVTEYPTWITTDEFGKEINRITGALNVANESFYPDLTRKIVGE